MLLKDILESKTERRDHAGNVYDWEWDEKKMGFHTTVNGVSKKFFKAKGFFDRSEAQEAAKTHMMHLYGDSMAAKRAADEHHFQFEKPLSQLEKEWVELEKRFMKLNDKELDRWKSLAHSGIIRKSLINGKHPEVKKDK